MTTEQEQIASAQPENGQESTQEEQIQQPTSTSNPEENQPVTAPLDNIVAGLFFLTFGVLLVIIALAALAKLWN